MANIEKLENKKVKYTVTVDADTFDGGIERAYKKNASRYSLPGFRKGKAPRKMLEKAYGSELFYMDAVDEVYWDAYVEAVNEFDEFPVEMPELDIVDIGAGKDLVFTATVAVRPTVELTDDQYKGIEVVKFEYNVTDAMVDAEVEKERENLARWVEADRPVQEGDRIVLDYSGAVDGVKFDGGTAEDQTLEIGSGKFIPGFEEQLIGKTLGQTSDISVKFPDEYHSAELAGKDAVFTCTIKEIKQKELPDLDDELAKDVSDFDTLDEYKSDVRAKLLERAQSRQQNAVRNAAVEALLTHVEIDVPEAMIEHQIDVTLKDMASRMSYQGISLEDYLKYTGMTEQSMREQIRPEANKRVVADLAIDAIIKKEGIEASEDEVAKEVETFAKQFDKTVEETRQMMGEREMEGVKYEIAIRKAVDLIVENAVLVAPESVQEQQADSEE